MDNIAVTTSISLKDFIRLNFYLYYIKPVTLIITSIAFFCLCGVGVMAVLYEDLDFSNSYGVFFCIFYVFLMPVIIYFSAKKNYKSNKMIQGEVLYQFGFDKVRVEGAAFNSEYELDALFKIKRFRNWLLLYHSKATAHFVDIRSFKNNDYHRLATKLQTASLPYKVKL